MIRHAVLLTLCLQIIEFVSVETAKQQVQLSDSYLPVAMQVIAHLTDQMAFEPKDEPGIKPPRPVTRPSTTTNRPFEFTTQYHKPGLYAPASPPKPSDREFPNWHQQHHQQQQFIMSFDFPQYHPIQPQNAKSEEPLLAALNEEIKPLMEPAPPATHLLPPHFDTDFDRISSRSKGFDVDELTEENLQYLSPNVREMLRMAYDPYDERLVDVWEGLRAHPAEPTPKGKLSSSNLRLLLLYDLLSREAKRQRLSDYSGYSPDVMRTLIESSGGGARAQLALALSKMVERHDCSHEYANNRAKEMVAELAKDESKLSSEIRYLQPLIYKQ